MERTLSKTEFDQELDLTGLLCPVPIMLTSERMKGLKEGQVLRVKATIEKDGSVVIAYIKKTSRSSEPSLWYWIKFHSLGVKLHARLFFTRLLPKSKRPDHFITFIAISEGIRAGKLLKNEKNRKVNINAKLLPVPDEIDPRCGVVLGIRGRENAIKLYNFLRSQNIGVEKIYMKVEDYYLEVENEG